jgi:aryl-alcohol dehydrogenase-like predicted oxidoreductase
METRAIGSLESSAIGLGCMGMSWLYNPEQQDDEQSIDVIRHAIDLGVRLIDTSDVYGPYTNEILVGRALAGRRDEVVLATKCGIHYDDEDITKREIIGRPDYIKSSCDASLQRLGVEVIDLYQYHRVDARVPIEETWGAFAELKQAGKVREIGLSEVTLEQLQTAQSVHPVASVQSELSLWTQDWVDSVLAYCTENSIAYLAYSPLGRGFLTGAVSTQSLSDDDWRNANPRFTPQAMEANQRIVDVVRAVAERHGCLPGQIALAWDLAISPVVIPIPGTKRRKYLEQNVGAADIVLTEQDMAELAAVPAPVGGRY